MPTHSFESLTTEIREGDVRALRQLVAKEFKADWMKDSAGNTLLCFAASVGALEAVELLIEAKADVNRANAKGRSAIWQAAAAGESAAVALLVQHSAGVDAADEGDTTPLIVALKNGRTDSALELLRAGANVNHADRRGFTPFYMAARYKNLPFLEAMATAGCRYSRPSDGAVCKPAIVAAARYADVDICRAVVALGASVDEQDANGVTPLMAAAYANTDPVIRFFIQSGARLDLRNSKGQTLAEYVHDSSKVLRVRRLIEEVLRGTRAAAGSAITVQSPSQSQVVEPAHADEARPGPRHDEAKQKAKRDSAVPKRARATPSQGRRATRSSTKVASTDVPRNEVQTNLTPSTGVRQIRRPVSPVQSRRGQRLLGEFRHAWQAMPGNERAEILTLMTKRFGSALLRRAATLAVLAARLLSAAARGVVGVMKDLASSDPRGQLWESAATALASARTQIGAFSSSAAELAERVRQNPSGELPELFVKALGFYAGSGGLDGNGGIPDTDIPLFGIGEHRSPLTHSVISGAIAEAIIVGVIDGMHLLHRRLPPSHDAVWDQLRDGGAKLAKHFQHGTSAGIAYHLAIDGVVQPGPYHDVPFPMPDEVHQAIFVGNAAGEGAGGRVHLAPPRAEAAPTGPGRGASRRPSKVFEAVQVAGSFLGGFWDGITTPTPGEKK